MHNDDCPLIFKVTHKFFCRSQHICIKPSANSCQLTNRLPGNTHASLPVRESQEIPKQCNSLYSAHTEEEKGRISVQVETSRNRKCFIKGGKNWASGSQRCRHKRECSVPGTRLSGLNLSCSHKSRNGGWLDGV